MGLSGRIARALQLLVGGQKVSDHHVRSPQVALAGVVRQLVPGPVRITTWACWPSPSGRS